MEMGVANAVLLESPFHFEDRFQLNYLLYYVTLYFRDIARKGYYCIPVCFGAKKGHN